MSSSLSSTEKVQTLSNILQKSNSSWTEELITNRKLDDDMRKHEFKQWDESRAKVDKSFDVFYQTTRELNKKLLEHDEVQKYLDAYPSDKNIVTKIYLGISYYLIKQGNFAKANEVAQRGLGATTDANSVAALYLHISCCFSLSKDYAKAIEAAQKGLDAKPTDANQVATLCECISIYFIELKNYPKAIEAAQKGLDAKPTDANQVAKLHLRISICFKAQKELF